jgi:2-isopropylmalate synthase
MTDTVTIFDTTLRDGEQAPGASMTVPEKLRIAQQLARLGVDVIEAGFPVSSPAQTEAVEEIIAQFDERDDAPVVCALARAVEGDVRAAGEALQGGAATRLHTFVATSDVHLDAKFERLGDTMAERREAVIERAVAAIRQARTYTDDVEFSAEDAGRTDPGYLREVVQAAVAAGATTVNVPDTTGYCMPSQYAALFDTVRDALPDTGPDGTPVTLSTHCHDDLGMATANTLAGVQAGARQVECTINGIGERAGNAALEEIVMALSVRSDQFGVSTNVDAQHLMEASRRVAAASGFPVQPNKAIVGRNAFSHEAGIHQHGVLASRETYEIMSAADVGQDEEQIRLGRHSGRHGLFSRLDKLGYAVADLSEDERTRIYDRFLDLADRKKEVFDEDLKRMMDAVESEDAPSTHSTDGTPVENGAPSENGTADLPGTGEVAGDGAVVFDDPGASTGAPGRAVPAYRLLHLSVELDTDEHPQARVRLRRDDGTIREEHATGDGPVDALYRAIDHAVDEPHTLVNYSIQSISEGSDAQGQVDVRVRYGENEYVGTAHHTDVVRASADAYVHALNRLAQAREEADAAAFVQSGIMQTFDRDA